MCSGAMIRVGLRRVLFGIRATVATPYLPGAAGAMVGSVPCRDVLALAPTPIDVQGPMLEDEARAPFEAFATRGPG
jgi:tRNA(Arg) A34 adenosine deaminase TadA